MKKLFFLVLLVGILAVSCGSTSGSAKMSNFSEATGKDWKLIEVSTEKKEILFNRKNLKSENAANIFTLRFDAENIFGAGAPNRYSAPYKLGEDGAISIEMVRTTLMASIMEPEKLREHDFFTYIQNAYEWNFVEKNLELTSKNVNGEIAKLIFSL